MAGEFLRQPLFKYRYYRDYLAISTSTHGSSVIVLSSRDLKVPLTVAFGALLSFARLLTFSSIPEYWEKSPLQSIPFPETVGP